MDHAAYCAQFVDPSASILDVGSGRGKFVWTMAERGFRVWGIEVNADYVRESERSPLEKGSAATILHGVAENLPFPDATFDFINCAEVTEHVEDPKKVCQEIFRVLKPGGKCYVSFHNRFGIFDYHYHLYGINWLPRSWSRPLLARVRPDRQDGSAGRQTLHTMNYFTYGQVVQLLAGIGFEVKDVRVEKMRKEVSFFPSLLESAYKLILRPFYFNSFHVLIKKSL